MVAYAQQEMIEAGQAPDASTTLFQDCTVAVLKVGGHPQSHLQFMFWLFEDLHISEVNLSNLIRWSHAC